MNRDFLLLLLHSFCQNIWFTSKNPSVLKRDERMDVEIPPCLNGRMENTGARKKNLEC